MAKFSAGKVNDVAKRVADKLKRQKEEPTNEVDPFDIFSGFEEEETSNPSQDSEDWEFEQALREENPDWSEEQIQEMLNSYHNMKDEEEPNVPEIETEVENLPEEDVNEKKIDVEYQPEEESELPPETTVVGQYDNIEIPESKPEDTFDENAVIDPPEDDLEETSVSEEEVMNAPDVPQPKPKKRRTKGSSADVTMVEGEDEPAKETNDKPKSKRALKREEENMNELRAMAQDSLEGFRYDKSMDKWTPKQKQDAIDKYMQNRKALEEMENAETEEETTEKPAEEEPKADEKGDGSTYERYPTELRVAEDVGQVLGKGVDIANQAVNKPLSGVSASDIADRAKIPHYDYTSLFGRR